MKAFLILILVLSPFISNAQNKTVDSLKRILSIQKEDTGKVMTLRRLASQFKYSNSDTAMYFMNAALELATKLNYEMGIALAKRGLCAICADQGRYNEGIQYGSEALIVYNQLLSSATGPNKDEILNEIARTYTVIGHNQAGQGNYAESLKSTLKALKISEDLRDKAGIAVNQFNVGNTYLYQHNYSEALKYFYAALNIYEELGEKGSRSYIHNSIGFLYSEQSNYPEALKNYSIALKLAEELNDEHNIAEIYTSIGEIHYKRSEYSESLKYDFAALKLFQKISFNEQIPFIYNSIASAYTKQKKYEYASIYLEKALFTAKEINSLNYIRLSYENMAALDSAKGNYKRALAHYKLGVIYRDSLLNAESTKKSVQARMQYEFDKRQDSIRAAQDKKDLLSLAEIQNQKTIRNFSLAGAVTLLSFGSLSFYRYRRRKKLQSQQEMLNERLRISRELHDDIGSTLGSISIYSEVAKNRSSRNEKADEAISKIGVASRELIEKMSDIVWSINPNNESFEQLQNRMQAFAAMMLTPRNIQNDFIVDEGLKSVQLNTEQRKNIFLIFKEAIYNALKYSECSKVDINLSKENSLLQMIIKDDGKGFDTEQLVRESLGGNGLKNMKARANDIGAYLKIESVPNKGTTVNLSVSV